MNAPSTGLVFGIHPFAVVGMAHGAARGAPDNFQRLPQIIDQLRGDREFILRTYVPYSNPQSTEGIFLQFDFCMMSGLPWDIVLCYRQDGPDLEGWLQVIRGIVQRYGQKLNTLQITNEPNLSHVPDAGDGAQPNVRQALVQGVIAAKEAVRQFNATVSIGFNAVPTFHSPDDFWPSLPKLDSRFAAALDYVGFDFYPDVFGSPIELAYLPAAVEKILREFRTTNLAAAGIPDSLPLRITENGWPTGPKRPYERQAAVLDLVIRSVHYLRNELNITHYELFSLRDADSANENSFYQFGIMRDDYTPKPAFDVYRALIRELGR